MPAYEVEVDVTLQIRKSVIVDAYDRDEAAEKAVEEIINTTKESFDITRLSSIDPNHVDI